MNTKRIKEIQKETDYPDSISVQQALLKVWNECEQGKVVKNNAVLHGVMWRFSVVLLIPITLILMVTVMPIRWLLTGKYRWKQREFPLLYNWGRKCGF